MLLRSRITLLLAGAIALIGAGLVGLGTAQRQLEAERLSAIAIELQRSLWDRLVTDLSIDLNLIGAELAARISTTSAEINRDSVARVIAQSPDIITSEITVQVVDLNGEIISANAPVFRSRPLIDRQLIARIRDGAGSVRGLLQDTPNRFVVLAVRPISVRGELVAVMSVSSDAVSILNALASEMGEPAFLLSPRGRLAVGTDPGMWAIVSGSLPPRPREAEFLDIGSRSYFVAPMSIPGISGRLAGLLVSVRDVTESLSSTRQVERVGLIAVAIVGLIIIGGLYLSLRNAFQPLESAVAALGALSKGDLSRPLETSGAREIARIGEAITVFRRNAQRLMEQDESISRQRRRQERVIRRELERLAALLDPQGRAEILEDLAAVLPDKPGGHQAPNAELAMLANLLQRMSTRIADQQSRLTALIEELQASIATKERLAALEQELDIARELQTSFLPKPLPPHPAFQLFGLMESAKEVGGDFFDTFMIDESRLGIVVADVSGKGVPAAMFMAITRTLLRATAQSAASPAETVREVNQFLAADNDQMMFVTLFHAVLDLSDGTFTYVNAGHNAPFRIAAEDVEPLARVGGPALAVVEEMAYSQEAITLTADTMVFAFTDGVTEAFSPDGEEYGSERLAEVIGATGHVPPEELCKRVRQSVLAFEDGGEQADDVTCFALRYTGTAQTADTI